MVSQVEEIKKKLDIVDVVGRYLPLRKRGHHFIANCPFHSEKTPSFTVSQELQIFKCFGCGKAGDIFTFVEEYDKVGFKDALEDLAKMAGIVLVKDPQMTQAEQWHKRLVELNFEVTKFYNYILTTHPLGQTALKYVLERGITQETIKLFKIGYAPVNSDLIYNYLIKKGFTLAEMVGTGTFGKSNYGGHLIYDRFADRLVFPLSDFRDRVLGFSGRLLPSSQSKNVGKYINSPETDIYHKSQMLFGLNLAKESIKKLNQVIIVEGEFDMISPYQSGVTNGVAIKGTAFTIDQLQLLHRYTDTLILGLDADFAGTAAARKSIELADSLGFDIKVIDLGDQYKDPDEAVTADPEFFKNQVTTAVPVWDFIIKSALKTLDSTTVKGKKDILNLVLPFLVKINNSVTRSDYYQKFASLIGSSPEAVVEEAGKLTNNFVKSVSNYPTPDAKVDKVERLEEYLLTLIFAAKNPTLSAQKISEKISFTISRFQKIFSQLLDTTQEKDSALQNPKNFGDNLSPELLPLYQNLYLAATTLGLESKHRLREINKTISQLLTITIKQQLTDVSSQLAQAENSGDESAVSMLELEYNQLLSKLSSIQSPK